MRGPCPDPSPPAPAVIDDLAAEHAGPVLAYVRSILLDHHASEDVVQETLLRAWQHRSRLDARTGSVRGWLLTVARNLALDRLRSAVSRREVLAADADRDGRGAGALRRTPGAGRGGRAAGGLPDRPGRAAQHRDPADAVELRDDLRSLLAGLPAPHREVLAWTYLVGLPDSETADALGVPVGTVRSRRHYALAELRRRAAPEPGD